MTGFLATVTMTAGATTPAGSRFAWSLMGSGIGFAGGFLATTLIAGANCLRTDEFYVPTGVAVGVLTLTHAAIATLIAN